MITNKKEYRLYRIADKIIAGRENISFFGNIKLCFVPDQIAKFLFLLRITEYYKNCSKTIIGRIIFYFFYNKFKKLSLKLGFTIPLNVFGPGLLIPHYGTIVINSNAKIGKCCVLHTCVCIAGSEVKEIGDFVYLSKGVTITGKVRIVKNVTISANSLVNKSCTNENSLLGGIPAKVLKQRSPWYISDGEKYTERVKRIINLFE